MKRSLLLLAAGIAALSSFGFYGCGANSTKPTITPAQFVAIACPPTQQALALAPTVTTLSGAAQKDVVAANNVIGAACLAGATVSIATVGDFAKTVLPAASEVVAAVPDSVFSSDPTTAAQKKAAITGGIALATIAVDTVVDIQASAAAASAASGASAAAPASTPVAASSTILASASFK